MRTGDTFSARPVRSEISTASPQIVAGPWAASKRPRGILVTKRLSGSSFSMLLGRASHLDGEYTVFGKVLAGDDVLAKLEQVETRKEGIFVMPKQRITISSAKMTHHNEEL